MKYIAGNFCEVEISANFRDAYTKVTTELGIYC